MEASLAGLEEEGVELERSLRRCEEGADFLPLLRFLYLFRAADETQSNRSRVSGWDVLGCSGMFSLFVANVKFCSSGGLAGGAPPAVPPTVSGRPDCFAGGQHRSAPAKYIPPPFLPLSRSATAWLEFGINCGATWETVGFPLQIYHPNISTWTRECDRIRAGAARVRSRSPRYH